MHFSCQITDSLHQCHFPISLLYFRYFLYFGPVRLLLGARPCDAVAESGFDRTSSLVAGIFVSPMIELTASISSEDIPGEMMEVFLSFPEAFWCTLRRSDGDAWRIA